MIHKRLLILFCAVLLISAFLCGCAKKSAMEKEIPATSSVNSENVSESEIITSEVSATAQPETLATEVTDNTTENQEIHTEAQIDFSDLE